MISAHHLINISQNILNLWMRLIFSETRHPGLQFEYKNEAIPIRIESDMIFRNWLYRLLQQLRENWTLLAPHSYQSSHLMHQISPNAKMRSMFMILCQPSLRHDSNYLNSLEYTWMFLNVLVCSSHVLGCSSHVHAYH